MLATSWALAGAHSAAATNYAGLHWAKPSSGYASMQVVDYSSSAYPVQAKTAEWDAIVRFNAVYVGQSCPSGSNNCFTVDNASYGANNLLGTTTLKVDSQGHYIPNSGGIHFNDTVANTTDRRQWVTCHELGHAVALEHTTYNSTCMYESYLGSSADSPDSHDFNYANNTVYNHTF